MTRSPLANASSRRATTARALSTAWPLAAISSRTSARAASAAGPSLLIATSRASGPSRSDDPTSIGSPRGTSAGARSPAGRRGQPVPPRPPIRLEDAHRHLVPPATVAPDRLARPALDDEAAALVGPDRPLVELEDVERDAVQPERPERVVEHQLGRFGAVALAPRIGLADGDVIERRTVLAVELAEGAGPDQAVGRLLVDGHRQRLGPDDPGGEEALDLLGPHRRRLVARQAGDLGVRVPAQERGDVARDVPAQHDSRADQCLREPPSAAPFSARYTIDRMRRWSELAERLAATTRTSEKTALVADYLRALTPEELPVAAVFLTGPAVRRGRPARRGSRLVGDRHDRHRHRARPARGARRGIRPLVRPRDRGRRGVAHGRPRPAARDEPDPPRGGRRVRRDRGCLRRRPEVRHPAQPARTLRPDDRQVHRQGARRRPADRPARGPGRGRHRARLRPPAR